MHYLIFSLFVFSFLTVLTPNNEKQVYLIGAAWGIQTVGEKTVNSETYDLAIKTINKKMKTYLEEEQVKIDK